MYKLIIEKSCSTGMSEKGRKDERSLLGKGRAKERGKKERKRAEGLTKQARYKTPQGE